VQNYQCIGIKDIYQEEIYSKTVIITTGTYLSSRIHVGLISYEAGRAGELNSKNLSQNLSDLGLQVRRFNTGTTPRIDKKTVNFEKLSIQEGTKQPIHFSFKTKPTIFTNQLPSYLGWTNEKTADVTKTFLKYQPSNTGLMVKVGPRTCPSLEEKIKWFPDRKRHSFFLEAEGFDTDEMYMAGLNMSVFPNCQEEIIRTISGLENASIIRPAYAIAYDWIDTSEINLSLETKKINNLFLAGQINGTTGYDEAAAQGLIAGINASMLLQGKEPFILNRSESYIGIMIDDLVNKNIEEPYRITPSHSEFRLSIREGNADIRLTEIGRNIGLVDEDRWIIFQEKVEILHFGNQLIQTEKITPKKENLSKLEDLGFPCIHQVFTLKDLLKRSDFNFNMIEQLSDIFKHLPSDIKEELEIESKYEGYIQHENNEMIRFKKLLDVNLPESLEYSKMISLSKDGQASLLKFKPKTLEEAIKLPNVKPSDTTTIISFLRKITYR
jgi:tRNA uridine 5-carboxymethylaminomethyl modification enzyme